MIIKYAYHDYFPTKRLLLANLSLVFKSNKHFTAIRSTTIKKSPTKSPDSTDGVIFKNKLLLPVSCWVVSSSNLDLLSFLEKYKIASGFSVNLLTN